MIIHMSDFLKAVRLRLNYRGLPDDSDIVLYRCCITISLLPASLSEWLDLCRLSCSDHAKFTLKNFESLTQDQFNRLVAGCSELSLLEVVADLLEMRPAEQQQAFRL